MSLQNNTPHNNFAKRFLTDLVLAREFLTLNLPQALVKLIDLSTLQPIEGEFVDEAHRTHQSDILYQVSTFSGIPLILYILIEHKSNPEKWAILQLLRYMLKKWEQDVTNGSDQLTPIVPILFYHGQAEWPYPTHFRAYFPQHEAWNLFIPDFEMVLRDFSEKSATQIEGSRHLQAMLHAFRTVQAKNFETSFIELVRFLVDSLTMSDPKGLKILMEIVYYYTEGAERLTLDQLNAAFKMYGREGEQVVQTIATQLRAEGRVEGRVEGRAEGERIGIEKERERMVVKLIEADNMTHAEIAALVDLPLAEIERIDRDRHANA